MDYGRALAPDNMQRYLHMWISWSLAVEEKFYLLWPLLLLLLRSRSKLIPAMVAIILGQWTYRAILYLICNGRWMYLYHTFDMRLDALLVGCLAAILVENDSTRLLCCGLLRWQSLSVMPPLVLAAMAIAPPSNKALFLLFWSIQPPIAAAMLLQMAYWGSKSWTVCSSGPVRVTAHLSYALYLYHPLATQIVYVLHMRHLVLLRGRPHDSHGDRIVLLGRGAVYAVTRPAGSVQRGHQFSRRLATHGECKLKVDHGRDTEFPPSATERLSNLPTPLLSYCLTQGGGGELFRIKNPGIGNVGCQLA
jgi:hypothetical protein